MEDKKQNEPTKCCGGCRNFKNEDSLGFGWCKIYDFELKCKDGNDCEFYKQVVYQSKKQK